MLAMSPNSKEGHISYPWVVETREGVGRVLVAVRDIKPLEVILEDEPVGLSPTQDAEQMCLQCFKLIRENNPYICSCGFPMCSEVCGRGERHRPEHELFIEAGVKGRGRADYSMVMPIRLLTQMDNSPALRDRLAILMDHRQERMEEKDSWDLTEKHFVTPLRNLCGGKDWSSEDIQRCVGLFRTNGLAVHATGLSPDQEWVDDDDLGMGRALYPTMCALSHSCIPNCRVMHSLNYKLVIRSAKEIKAGEELTICYTSLFNGAISRKADLINNWFFECLCPRCKSGDNFSPNFDSWVCQECGNSILPQDDNIMSNWQCNGCSKIVKREDIKVEENKIKAVLEKIPDNKGQESVELCEKFLVEQKTRLHPDHFFNMQAKLKLMFSFTTASTVKDLKRKVEICKYILNMLDKIKLGFVEVRGLALYELSVPTLVLLKAEFDGGQVSVEEFKEGLSDIVDNLETSIRCLEVEETGTYRKLIADRATHILHQIKELIMFSDYI